MLFCNFSHLAGRTQRYCSFRSSYHGLPPRSRVMLTRKSVVPLIGSRSNSRSSPGLSFSVVLKSAVTRFFQAACANRKNTIRRLIYRKRKETFYIYINKTQIICIQCTKQNQCRHVRSTEEHKLFLFSVCFCVFSFSEGSSSVIKGTRRGLYTPIETSTVIRLSISLVHHQNLKTNIFVCSVQMTSLVQFYIYIFSHTYTILVQK